MRVFIVAVVELFLTTALLIQSVLTLDISYPDLKHGHGICGPASSCRSEGSSFGSNDIWDDRNCQCDSYCNQYGDCCVDSERYNAAEQRRVISSFNCLAINERRGVYMKATCPPNWKNANIRKQCEQSRNVHDKQDPLLQTPVTSLFRRTTYGNIYCAVCNDDYRQIEYWQMGLSCAVNQSVVVGSDSVQYNVSAGYWQISLEDGSARNCSVNVKVPAELDNATSVRSCLQELVKGCAPSWTNSDIRNHCEAYTSVVYNGGKAYRNPYCGMCNNVPVQNLKCNASDETSTRFAPPTAAVPFTVLFDFNGGLTVGKMQPCKSNQLYDPFFRKCRDVFDFNEMSRSLDRSDDELKTCPKYTLAPSEFVSLNGSGIFVPEYRISFDSGSYIVNEDNSAAVCVNRLPGSGKRLVSKYKPYFGVLTVVGIGISVLCLTFHLLAFCLVEDLRNLAGMNLASFCFALLIAYCAFILGDMLDGGGRSCFLDAIATYYFFLAAFFWMMTIAFDVWRALRVATSELRVNTGKQWKKFVIYSCWSWLMPANVVLVAILVEMSPKGYISDNFHPNFGTVSCWFGSGEALLVFLGLPLSVIMASNVVFFVSSSFMIYSSQSMTVYSASSDTLKNFKLFSRLALIMGLTWITGLVGGAVDNELVWVIFILLNTLQGLFVFIGFTCRSRVLNAIKEIGLGQNRLQNFSTTSASTSEMELAKARKSSATINTTSTYY